MKRVARTTAALLSLTAGFGVALTAYSGDEPARENVIQNLRDFHGYHARRVEIPRYVVDPWWPKPLPNRWVTGAVGGICIDHNDHVFGINRSDITALELRVVLGRLVGDVLT